MKKTTYAIYFIFLILITALLSLNLIGGGPFSQMSYTVYQNSTDGILLLKRFEDLRKVCKTDSRNSLGFYDSDWEQKKSGDVYRIIALGDSMTQSVCIYINETWPKQLENKLNNDDLSRKFEVLNFGGGGLNTIEELAIFKKYEHDFNPNMVILQYYFNDLEPTSAEINDKAQEIFKKWKSGEYKLPANMEEDYKKFNMDNNSVYMAILLGYLNTFYKDSNLEEEWNKNVGQPLTELISICKERNIKLFVITWDFDQGLAFHREKIQTLLKNNEIDFYDFTSDMPFRPFPSVIRLPDGHLTVVGNGIVANKTFDILVKNFGFT